MKTALNYVVSPMLALLTHFGLADLGPAFKRLRYRRKRDPLRYQAHTHRRSQRRQMTLAMVRHWRKAMLTVTRDVAKRKAAEKANRPPTRARCNKLWTRIMAHARTCVTAHSAHSTATITYHDVLEMYKRLVPMPMPVQ